MGKSDDKKAKKKRKKLKQKAKKVRAAASKAKETTKLKATNAFDGVIEAIDNKVQDGAKKRR